MHYEHDATVIHVLRGQTLRHSMNVRNHPHIEGRTTLPTSADTLTFQPLEKEQESIEP